MCLLNVSYSMEKLPIKLSCLSLTVEELGKAGRKRHHPRTWRGWIPQYWNIWHMLSPFILTWTNVGVSVLFKIWLSSQKELSSSPVLMPFIYIFIYLIYLFSVCVCPWMFLKIFLLKYRWCTVLYVTGVQYSVSQFLKVILHL